MSHRGRAEGGELEKFEFRNSNFEILLCVLCVLCVLCGRYPGLWLRHGGERRPSFPRPLHLVPA